MLIDDDPFEFPGLKYVETVEDSRRLVEYKESCVTISASGTADARRIRHHINSCIANENCGILLVRYCGGGSLGRQLLSGAKEVNIFYDKGNVAAHIGQLQGMSAHGDAYDLTKFISNQRSEKVKGIFLVHGEHAVQKTFAEKLSLNGYGRIECPAMQQEFELPFKTQRMRKRIPIKQEKILTE